MGAEVQSTNKLQKKLDNPQKTLKDGSIIEGLAPGNKVMIITSQPEFVRDILPYFSNSIMIFIAVIMIVVTNNFYLPMFFVYLVSPLQNYFGKGDNKNVSPKSQVVFANDKRFDYPLHFFVIFETVVWLWALTIMSDKVNPTGFWFDVQKPQTNVDYFGFTLLVSFFSAINAVVGHELIHHRETHNKFIGTIAVSKLMACQWVDEHIKGHHKTVSTLEDPATSRKNEPIFTFILRSMYGQVTNVWGYENDRLIKKYGKDMSMFTRVVYNKFYFYQLVHIVILIGVYKIFGWEAFKFQMYYIIIGLYLFETVNYIEHYGILRKKDANGVYESINKMHSWNYLSGAVIVRIQRHSDHHAHSFRPYQILRRMDDAPYLAFEYLHCYFLATIPPLWFYIMNPKVEALEDIRLGRKNEKNTQWNNIMPLTMEDRKRMAAGWFAIFLFQCTLGYLCFSN